MNWLPEGTTLGDLRITETFVDFDGPRVFACPSSTDQLFLAGWAQEGEEADTWLYLPISLSRFQMVRSGGMTLRRSFLEPEGPVYRVAIPHVDGPDAVEPISPEAIEETWLPAAEFSLDLPTHTLPPAESGEEFERKVRQEARPRLRLMVKLPKYYRSEAPTKRVGELLTSTQSLYDNVGLALLDANPPQFGRIPIEVAQKTATDVVALSAASFVIEIASSDLDDLLGDSVFSVITERVLDLFSLQLGREELIDGLSQLRPRGAKSFRNFVRVLANTQGSVTIAGAATQMPYTERVISAERLQTLQTILNTLVPDDIFEIRGRMRLYRADMDRKQFGLMDEQNETRYEGRIADRALAHVDHATVNETYDVVVSEFRTFDEAVGERRPVHILEQLTTPEEGVEAGPVIITRISEASGVSSPEA